MPRKLTRGEWQRFLKGRHVCVLATIGTDGAPVLTPIWYLYKRGKILMRTDAASAKTLNIKRDPRVSVCVQDEHAPYKSVTAHGRAEIEPEKKGLGGQIARRYLGFVGGMAYMLGSRSAVEQQAEEITIVVTPDRIVTQDYSSETPAIGKAWLIAKRVLPPWL